MTETNIAITVGAVAASIYIIGLIAMFVVAAGLLTIARPRPAYQVWFQKLAEIALIGLAAFQMNRGLFFGLLWIAENVIRWAVV